MPINPEALYLQLGRLVSSMPELRGKDPITPEINQWLGRAIALVEASGADKVDIITLKVCAQGLDTSIRNQNAQTVATIVHSALARAEMNAPASAQGAFIAAGDTLNAFAAVGKVLARAKSDILMVDAFADQSIITDFAITAPERVNLRILGANKEARKLALRPAAERWVTQFGQDRPIEVRVAPAAELHDRLILIDGTEAWFAGQSFNGMAQRSHTSIEKSDPELAAMKVQAYEALWSGAKPL
jgi:hypothetical protein